jgi:hypothetical protein
VRNLALTLMILFLPFACFGEIIQSSNRVDWVPGLSVGVQGGIAWRTTIYTNFYTTNTAAEINAGIASCPSNQVVMLNEQGVFDVRTGLSILKDGVSLRGLGSNTIVFGAIQIGQGISGNNYPFTVISGGGKGTTNLVVTNLVDQFGSSLVKGDALKISADFDSTNQNFQVLNVGGYGHFLNQQVVIHSINGNTISITTPLVFDFTNNPVLFTVNLPGIPTLRPLRRVGLEDLTVTITNAGTLLGGNTLSMTMCNNSWVTNVNVMYANNYHFYFQYNVSCTVAHCQVRYALGAGSNHGGMLVANDVGCLIEDNIISDGLFPGIEFNDGFVGNAVFANFFTNNLLDIDCHNSHPIMNLWEANVMGVFEMDGYFGSASHQTLFRNRGLGTVAVKRFTSYMQVVGNVLGNPTYAYVYEAAEIPNYPTYGIFELGFPNIGNNGFTFTSPPTGWNWPGTNIFLTDNTISTNYQMGAVVLSGTQGPTNILYGNFTNKVASREWWPYTPPNICFQDAVNTNLYHYGDGTPIVCLTNYGDRILINQTVTTSNGWKLFMTSSETFQTLQTLNKATHTLHGNAVCTNQSTYVLVWDAGIADHTLPASLLYTNGAPSWWGTNRWPAIDPEATVPTASIPAQNRFIGIPLAPDTSTNNVNPNSLDFGTNLVGTVSNQTVVVTNSGDMTLSGSVFVSSPYSVSNGTYSLAPGAAQTVTVIYSPSSAGTHSQNATFSGGGGRSVSLLGVATNTPSGGTSGSTNNVLTLNRLNVGQLRAPAP